MFTFRTYIRPLKVLEKRTDVTQRLLAAFMRLPEEVVSMHNMMRCSVSVLLLSPIWVSKLLFSDGILLTWFLQLTHRVFHYKRHAVSVQC